MAKAQAAESAMDRNLALEAVRVTEAAALAASAWMGRGNEKAADQAAVDAMRTALNSLAIDGTVVIGEGERDEAPMLYIGEKVGRGGPKIDIALDPLEGTTITAKGAPNALAVIAMADHGHFLNAPDVYMDKLAVGGGLPEGVVPRHAPRGRSPRSRARTRGADHGAQPRCRSCGEVALCRRIGRSRITAHGARARPHRLAREHAEPARSGDGESREAPRALRRPRWLSGFDPSIPRGSPVTWGSRANVVPGSCAIRMCGFVPASIHRRPSIREHPWTLRTTHVA